MATTAALPCSRTAHRRPKIAKREARVVVVNPARNSSPGRELLIAPFCRPSASVQRGSLLVGSIQAARRSPYSLAASRKYRATELRMEASSPAASDLEWTPIPSGSTTRPRRSWNDRRLPSRQAKPRASRRHHVTRTCRRRYSSISLWQCISSSSTVGLRGQASRDCFPR